MQGENTLPIAQSCHRFLWVNLQLQHLCTVSEARKDRLVEAALDDIPKGLNTTYTRMLRQIDNQEPYMRALALKCFAWVVHAKRLLRPRALQDAIATKSPCRSQEDLELDEVDVILKACANLIAEENGFIRPIHYSVQEFFTNPGLGSLQGCCLENIREPNFAHRILATSCLSHLQLDVLAEGPCYNEFQLYHRLREYPFLWYAARFFDRHVLDLPDLPEEVFDLVTTLLNRDGPSLAAVLQILAVQDPFDYSRISGDFTKVSFEVSASTILYSTVLFDVPQIAKQYAGIALSDYVLHRASAGGLIDLVIRLIGEGYDVKEEDDQGVTSLYYSCSGGHTEVMERLVQAGADVNAQGGYYGNALQAAAVGSHGEVVERLLQAGVDVNTQGGFHGNALQAAARGGHEKMVEQLLQAGADTNAQGGEYGNALQAAVIRRHEKIVEQLLQAGADVNAQGGKYGNALQAAAVGGHEKMVEQLLQAGADVNAQGGKYGNAAAYGDHEKIVEQLLQTSTGTNAQSREYSNAL
jgi:ankyrin repeat domain-containing protein 50